MQDANYQAHRSERGPANQKDFFYGQIPEAVENEEDENDVIVQPGKETHRHTNRQSARDDFD